MYRPTVLLADRWPILAVSVAFALAGLVLQLSQPMGHDLAWLVHATGRLLDGADVYGRELVEWNPPPNLHLLIAPVGIARVFDFSVLLAVRIWIALLLGTSVLITNAVARVALLESEAIIRRWAITALVFALFVWVGESYGQREHLIIGLLLPEIVLYAVLVAGRSVGRPLSIAAGTMAGVALCLKPHYVLVIFVLELILVARTRSVRSCLRVDLLAWIVVCALELGLTLVATPAYATFMVPLALDSYWVYQAYVSRIVTLSDGVWAIVGVAALLLLGGRVDARRLGSLLLVASATFYAIAIVQRTGWDYHLIPYHVTLMVLAGIAAGRCLDSAPRARAATQRSPWTRAGVAALAGCITLAGVLLLPTRYGTVYEEGRVWRRGGTAGFVAGLERVMVEHAKDGSVYVVSPSLVSVFPAVQHAGVRWTSRFAGFYLPAAVVRQRRGDAEVPARLDAARAAEIETYLRNAVIEDLERDPPDLILIDQVRRRKVFAGIPFDFVEYLIEDPRFAKIWSGYESIGRVGRFLAVVPR